MDTDLEQMSREQLVEEVRKLRQGIREHRDSTRHELCWHHPALWGLLPEKTDPIPEIPDWPQFLEGCLKYRRSLDEQLPNAPRTSEPYQDTPAEPAPAGPAVHMSALREVLWQQFGAAIDMLENAMLACPDKIWSDRSRQPEVWYMVYHTLFYLDLYLSDSVDKFTPPVPFTLDELDPAGLLPDRVYTKDEMHTYLEHGRRKCRATIAALTDEKAGRPCGFEWVGCTNAEIHLYNMRHVQHHAAQLNLILRQANEEPPRWVKRAQIDLRGA